VGAFPERINNLYFTYLFLLRAISKAGPDLLNYDYDTGQGSHGMHQRLAVCSTDRLCVCVWPAGNPADDAVVRENIKALVMASSAERDGSGRVVQGCRRWVRESLSLVCCTAVLTDSPYVWWAARSMRRACSSRGEGRRGGRGTM
jgi:hypothetical protein